MNYLQHIWSMLRDADKSERFLLQIILAFAVVDLLTLNFILAATELAAFAIATYLSYRDWLWFDDNKDNIDMEDVVDILLTNPKVRDTLAGQMVQAMDANNGNLTPGEDLKLAAELIHLDMIEGR